MPGSIDLERVQKRGVPDPVAINFAARRKPSMKIRRGQLTAQHPHLTGQMGIERGEPHISREFSFWNINVSYLSHGMNSGIRATGTVNLRSGSQNLAKSCDQMVLHRIAIRLALPTRKSSAVVGDGES